MYLPIIIESSSDGRLDNGVLVFEQKWCDVDGAKIVANNKATHFFSTQDSSACNLKIWHWFDYDCDRAANHKWGLIKLHN